ncbi:hypothetical protein KCP78_09810 [Salmonella enterica subsp. enterica]|nr:hypothetical protein KCP78_09810 [Salmonella enterica subsp. enterica]
MKKLLNGWFTAKGQRRMARLTRASGLHGRAGAGEQTLHLWSGSPLCGVNCTFCSMAFYLQCFRRQIITPT